MLIAKNTMSKFGKKNTMPKFDVTFLDFSLFSEENFVYLSVLCIVTTESYNFSFFCF